jgi:hypothetical protein
MIGVALEAENNGTFDQNVTLPGAGLYSAMVTDPVAPAGGAITIAWTKVSGPGDVTFDHPGQAVTHARRVTTSSKSPPRIWKATTQCKSLSR